MSEQKSQCLNVFQRFHCCNKLMQDNYHHLPMVNQHGNHPKLDNFPCFAFLVMLVAQAPLLFALNQGHYALCHENVGLSMSCYPFPNLCTSRKHGGPFCNYVFNWCSTTNQVENYTYSCNLFFVTNKYLLQLLTNNVNKYKSKMYAMCQHHSNN